MNKLLLTGASGFLGKQLSCSLSRKYEVFGISGARDLRCLNVVNEILEQIKPDIVVHAAANCGGIEYNKKNPYDLFTDNILMGVNLIKSSIEKNVGKFVLISTICSYPKFTECPFKESELWNGYPEETNAPYGIAKKSLQVMLESARSQFGFNGITVLPVNMAGPGDHFNETSHIIPLAIMIIDKAKKSKTDAIFLSSGNATREFIHVRDCSDAISLCTEKYDEATPINIGTGKEISIRELVNKIAEKMEFTGNIVWESKLDGQPRRVLDISKISSLGFLPRFSIDDVILDEIETFRRIK